MQRQIKTTADGSHTIVVPDLNVTYHSHHGAIAESKWVFIDAGLFYLLDQPSRSDEITILEIGFGTGLNALLTLKEAIAQKQKIKYITLEPFPLTEAEAAQLNHGDLLGMNEMFQQLHSAPWEKDIIVDPFFTLHKKNIALADFSSVNSIDCIYFDAFAPTDQPELWTAAVFENLYKTLTTGGILVTYSSKSIIRKAMQAAGFHVTKIPGPHGKRDMVRAFK